MHNPHESNNIKHIAMWRLKENVDKSSQAAQAKKQLERIKHTITAIRDLEVGRNLAASAGDYDIVLTVTVANTDALKSVLESPHYQAALAYMDSISDAHHVVDYDRQTPPSELLRAMICSEQTLVMPDAYDALSAKLIQQAGFQAVQCSGYSMATAAGLQEECLLSRDYNLQMTQQIVEAVSVPVMADGEDGYGDAKQVGETVCKFMDIGVAGINIEDHILDGDVTVRVVDRQVMINKIKTAREAADRFSAAGLVINARTDVLRAGPDRKRQLSKAAQRANDYLKAGADLIFVPYVADLHEVAFLQHEIAGPLSIAAGLPYNKKAFTVMELCQLGIARVSLPIHMIQSAIQGMQQSLNDLRRANG